MPARAKIKLVVLDLDRVLWDYHDASSIEPPLSRIGDRIVADSRGVKITLRKGVREFLSRAKSSGIFLSTCSWNDRDKALMLLRAFYLDKYFDYIMIEPHPEKQEMMRRILDHFRDKGVEECDVLFVDDREDMLEKVKAEFPCIKCLRFHPRGDVFDFSELIGRVNK